MTYHPLKKRAHSDDPEHSKFQAWPFIFGRINLSGDLSESMSFNATIERDNILSNNVSFTFINRTDNFRFEFGPFIGMGDRLETPNVGIIGNIEFTFPGILFFSFGGSATLGAGLDFTSTSSRESAEAKIGFWLPNVIPSFSASTRSLSWQQETNLTLRDTLTRFQLSAEIFFKNLPVIIRVDAGYEIYTRSYKSGNAKPIIDTLNAWYVGLDANIQVSKPLRIKFGLEVPLFYSAVGPMVKPDTLFNIFKANAGIVYTFF